MSKYSNSFFKPVTVIAFLLSPLQVFSANFEYGDVEGSVNFLFSAGAQYRTQDRDESIVSKRNTSAYAGFGAGDEVLCADNETGGDPTLESISLPLGVINVDEDILGGCVINAAEHQAFVDATGLFTQNTDQGNLNYDKGDMVHAVFKTSVDVDLTWKNYGLFARLIGFYDVEQDGRKDQHIDTIHQSASSFRTKAVEDDIVFSTQIEDFYANANWDIGDRSLSMKLGSQTIGWGESLTFVVNSINSINSPNVIRLNTPGLDLKELFDPVSMLSAEIDVSENVAMQAFYQLDWKPIELPPVGDFFSTSDVAGRGLYAMLSFGKEPEDPSNIPLVSGKH